MPNKNINLRLLCNGVKIDDRTEEYVRKRIQKIEKYINNVLEYEVEICMDKKGKFRVELMVKTPYDLFRAEETSESIEGSIDMAMDQLQIQIVRAKDRLKDLRERGARSIKKKVVLDSSARFRQ